MKRSLSLAVLVALACALAPSPAAAQGSRGRGGHLVGSSRPVAGFSVAKRFSVPEKSVFPQPVDPWRLWGAQPARKQHHGGRHAPFVGTPGFIATPSVVVSVPVATEVIDASTTIVYASPAVPAPAAGVALGAAPTPPMQTLIDHPGGWYQLRGDGVTTPYSWVWIPKPPAPPAAPSEPGPAAEASDAPARSADSSPRDSRGPAYQWTDDRGVTTFTNRLERVPKRFRDQAAAVARPE